VSTADEISTGAPTIGRSRPGARKAWAPEAGEEIAALLRTLSARNWLTAGRDDELIAAVRRNATALRDVFVGRLGWPLVVERDLVRLRKTPPTRRAAYAADGPSPQTCSWFFLLVAAAEGMPPKVSIAQLVTAARAVAAEAGLPVAHDLPERRAIAAALRLLDERGVIERMDGELEGFLVDENAPVLLAVHHTRLVHVIANFAPGDPVADPEGWLELVEREPDPARRMRRRLVDDTVVHTDDLDAEEADWLSRRGRGDDGAPLAAAFGLHLERRAEGAAFVVPDEAFRHLRELGPRTFPSSGTVAHAALLLIDAAAVDGDTTPERPGWRTLPEAGVRSRLTTWGRDIGAGRGGWSAENVENPVALAGKVADLLTGLDLLRVETHAPASDTDTGATVDGPWVQWWFSPATGRWASQTAARPLAAAASPSAPGSGPTGGPATSAAARPPRSGSGDAAPETFLLDLPAGSQPATGPTTYPNSDGTTDPTTEQTR
jgi:uncharacterized protein (TIGR02678 family)